MEAGLKKAQCNHRQKEIRGRDMSWKIGNVRIENPFVLAPMAGVTDMPFRTLCKEQGAGLICMEMISAKAISFHNKNTSSFVLSLLMCIQDLVFLCFYYFILSF